MSDELFMKEALLQARMAADIGETPVGAVIVCDGEVIARGKNERETGGCAVKHAEILAIEQACAAVGGWRLCGCTLYVTLEPCPMCAGAIIMSRIDRVVYGAKDPKAGCAESVTDLFSLPFNHRPEITRGVLERECGDILSEFFKNLRAGKQT